jgi:hypothetical protein
MIGKYSFIAKSLKIVRSLRVTTDYHNYDSI